MIEYSIKFRADRITYPKSTDISAVPAARIILRDTLRGVKMKQIPLVNNRGVALIDDEDYDLVSKYKWYLLKKPTKMYAVSHRKDRTILKMHRLVMGEPKGMDIDHRFGTGLDNQKSNLRVCTRSQNNMNRGKISKATSSKYKGVCWSENEQKWLSLIKIKGKRIYIGSFVSEVKAAKAYDKKARELFGEFAKPNFAKEN